MLCPEYQRRNIQTSFPVQNKNNFIFSPCRPGMSRPALSTVTQRSDTDVRCALTVGPTAVRSAVAHTSALILPAAADQEIQGH